MSYDRFIGDVVKGIEAAGVAIMVVGGIAAFVQHARRMWHPETRVGSYERLRRHLGRVILLGLEVLIVADIVHTVVIDATLESVTVLAIVVVIRIILSFSLEVEIDGAWPWTRRRMEDPPPPP